MGDPRFDSVMALEVWEDGLKAVRDHLRKRGMFGSARRISDRIERVRDAHAHLLGATPSKGTPNV